MDRPRQSDSFAGHMEGQIIGIACGTVGLLFKIMRGGVDHNINESLILQEMFPDETEKLNHML